MSDNLKEWVSQQRDEFEVYPFDEEIGWSEISDQIRTVPRRSSKVVMLVAASVSIALVSLASVFFLVTERDQPLVSSEWMEAEGFYQKQINSKMHLVKSKLDDQILLEDLKQMDQVFKELKKDLRDDADNEEVVAAMIDNYRLKLKILERILDELEEESDEENKNI